ncbi:uncharacterized protein LOC116206404 [Punica granatum]|uniref:Uncharacterized protein n=2 Tax=Punica granatum TaxID=22663 RepID=A0A2I0L7C9_PUNGR|nr:uncharacterized protein LOC116206404 [Punica granatum]PKI76607.1 hypothetical protein CRG98_002916 [Punica granatum]
MQRGLRFISWWVILVVLRSAVAIPVLGSDGNSSMSTPESLDDYILKFVNESLKRPRTGTVYKVSLPPSFSGIEVSVVRFRSSSFWVRGVNFSDFWIPPRIIPMPYVKRLVIVFENLHNLSSHYYHVPGYELIAPVLGFSAYDASNSTVLGSQKLNLSTDGTLISIHFLPFPEKHANGLIRCVALGMNKSYEFSNMTSPNVCSARHQGHFSLAVPLTPSNHKKEGDKLWKWWVVGFVGGFFVLALLCLVVLCIHRLVVRRKIKEMEKQSERGVPLDTFYIGRTKLPSASMIRTQPSGVENEYVS